VSGDENVVSITPTIPKPPPMAPPPHLLLPGPGEPGKDDKNSKDSGELPWGDEQQPGEDELTPPPVDNPDNPTPSEVLATLLAVLTAMGVAGARRLWLQMGGKDTAGRDRQNKTDPRTPSSPTGRDRSRSPLGATGRDRSSRDRTRPDRRDHDRPPSRPRSRDHDRDRRRRRDRSEDPVATAIRKAVAAARRRAAKKRAEEKDGPSGQPRPDDQPRPARRPPRRRPAGALPSTRRPALDRGQPTRKTRRERAWRRWRARHPWWKAATRAARARSSRTTGATGADGGTRATTPPPPPPPGGMRPPPGATRIWADAEVVGKHPHRPPQPPPPAAAYRHKPPLPPGPDDHTGHPPATRGALMTTTALAHTGAPPRHDDPEITVHDVIEAGRDAAQEIQDGAALANRLVDMAIGLGAQFDTLRADAAELSVPGTLVADLTALSERAGVMQGIAAELAAALIRAADAVRAAADTAEQHHRPLADTTADHGHDRPADADYHKD